MSIEARTAVLQQVGTPSNDQAGVSDIIQRLLVGGTIPILSFAAQAEEVVPLKLGQDGILSKAIAAPVTRWTIYGSMRDFSIARAGKAKSTK